MTLRPYQEAALAAIVAHQQAGQNRLLVKKPTGTGKTVTFAAMLQQPDLKAWLEQFPKNERKMLVIAHREELLDQAADKIARSNPGIMVSIEQGPRAANRYSDVVIASIQTLAAQQFKRLKILLKYHQFRIVVVDEAHHAAAPSYRTALVHLGFLPAEDASDTENIEAPDDTDIEQMQARLEAWDKEAPRDRLLVGVTATPNRSDAIGLGCVFQAMAFSYALRDAINDQWLVPITPWVVDTSVSLDGVRTNRGDFNQKDLADAVNLEQRNQLAVDAWRKYANGRSTIAFTVDVQHAHDLAACFVKDGIVARAVSGETPKDERPQVLADFTAGTIQVITNCMVLTEGTDLPIASCILHAKPTKSATLYEQMTGRGLRLYEGKQDCIVIDMVDVAKRHSLQVAPVLYGLPPGLISKEGKSLNEMAELFEQFASKHTINLEKMGRVSIEDLQVQAQTFDIWQIPSLGAFGAGRAMNWVKVGADAFRLQYPWAEGMESLTVAPDILGRYSVVCTLRPADRSPVRQRTLVDQVVTADEAAGVAEAFVLAQRRSVTGLVKKEASWRDAPPSVAQLSLLNMMKVPFQKGITKGQASDLITLAKARKGR